MAKAKNAPASAALNMTLLASVAMATIAGGVLYIPATPDATALVGAGLIEVNASMLNDKQEAAARATEAGIAKHNEANAGAGTAGAAPAVAAKPKFEIETIAMPVAKRNPGGAQNLYPFDDLPAPGADGKVSAFFVPVTAERPEPWKSLASTVSSAQKRYATKTGTENYTAGDGSIKQRNTYSYGRKFRVSPGEKNGTKGAYVSRTA